MAKFKLQPVDDFPYHITGINTAEPLSRMCWSINKSLGISLARTDDIEVIDKKSDSTFHACYRFDDAENEITFRLVQNKTGLGVFLPEYPQADLLLVVDDHFPEVSNRLAGLMRKLDGVHLAFVIQVDSLKTKQNLLLLA